MEQPWGWLIVIYLFLGGLGAGAYLTSFAAGKGWIKNCPALERAGYFIGAPAVALGSLCLFFDLGQGFTKPWLLFRLTMNPHSLITWGFDILNLFILVGLIVIYYIVIKKKEVPQGLLNVGAILALATAAYSGLLLTVIQAVPLWNTFLMPFLFTVSALSTGMSATALLAHFLEKGMETDERKVSQIHIGLVGVELILILALIGSLLAGLHGPVGIESASMIISGSLSLPFWILLVGIGLLIPICIFTINTKRLAQPQNKKQMQVELDSTTNQEEQTATSSKAPLNGRLILAVDTGVIVGGFILRYVMLFGALPLWNGKI
jgi:Formate-dependent nitrite reductase, membrane component